MKLVPKLFCALLFCCAWSVSNVVVAAVDSASTANLVTSFGDPNAPVKIVQVQSCSCPYSQESTLQLFPKLKKKYIDSGKVFFVSMAFAHNSDDMKVMKIAQCASRENYWPLIKTIYKERQDWIMKRDKMGVLQRSADTGHIKRLAKRHGLDESQLEQCQSDINLENKLLATRLMAFEVYNLFQSPQYNINGKIFQELSWADMQWVVDGLLKERK